MTDELNLSRLEQLNTEDRARVTQELKNTLDQQLGLIGTQVRPTEARNEFQAALTKLASDVSYRTAATANPVMVTTSFKLSLKELQALRQVAVLSGADVTAVDRLRAQSITRGVDAIDSIDVSCCSCCCCCCGDTAVAIAG